MFENIIPIAQVPTKISIAEKTLRNWRYKGMYPQIFVKLGGKVFVDLDELAKIKTTQQEKAKRIALRHDL
jgi:hypothetical protein